MPDDTNTDTTPTTAPIAEGCTLAAFEQGAAVAVTLPDGSRVAARPISAADEALLRALCLADQDEGKKADTMARERFRLRYDLGEIAIACGLEMPGTALDQTEGLRWGDERRAGWEGGDGKGDRYTGSALVANRTRYLHAVWDTLGPRVRREWVAAAIRTLQGGEDGKGGAGGVEALQKK